MIEDHETKDVGVPVRDWRLNVFLLIALLLWIAACLWAYFWLSGSQ